MPIYIEREAILDKVAALVKRITPIEESRDMFYRDSGWNGAATGARLYVENAPAADVVEVVRCKDCNHFADAKGKDTGKPCGYGQCKLPTGVRGIVCADDFCSFGERRESE